MKLELTKGYGDMREYQCELTRELDKLSGIDKEEYYYIYFHYMLRDKWHDDNKCFSIRVPGGTLGIVRYDDDFKIISLEVDTDYVVETYPRNVNELIQKYIGVKIEF